MQRMVSVVSSKVPSIICKTIMEIEKYYNNRAYPDVIFVFDGGNEENAHKCILADRCDYFKLLFDENPDTRIYMNGTSFKIFKELIKYCYLQKTDISHWSYSDKRQLLALATKYNYGPLMSVARSELEKRPAVQISAESLNEWYESSPVEVISEWVTSNLLKIFNYEDCHKYSKDLIVFILDALNEMYDQKMDRFYLRTVLKKVLHWIFRWRFACNRNEEDVRSIYDNVKQHLVLALCVHGSLDIKQLSQSKKNQVPKPVLAVVGFWHFRQLDPTGWTCDEALQLLRLAYECNCSQFVDAVVKVVGTKYLDSSTFAKIHEFALELESNKLEEVMVGYLKSHTKSLLTSVEFSNYPVSVTEFILEHLKGQMKPKLRNQLMSSICKWKALKSENEVAEVFSSKFPWEDYSRQQLASVVRWLIPFTRLADISEPPTFAVDKGVKRKHNNDSPGRKRGRPPKV